MAFMDIFIGVPQSKFAGLAILLAIVFVAFAILIGKEPIPMGQRFMFILILFLISLPGLLLTLFQLTCLVTGAGLKNQRWWCSLYAWIGSILIILYSVILVVAAILSMTQGTSMMKELAAMEQYESPNMDANQLAKELFENTPSEATTMPPAMPDMKMESFSDPTGVSMSTGPSIPTGPSMTMPMGPVKEPFENDEEIAPMEPETFSSCGAPVPSS
jgi:hypothetical protein